MSAARNRMRVLLRRAQTGLGDRWLEKQIGRIYAKRLDWTQVKITEAPRGNESRVFFVSNGKYDTALKIPKIGNDIQAFREFSASRAWQKLGLPVPEVLEFDDSYTIVPFPYIIEAKIHGAKLRKDDLSLADTQSLLFTIGALLRRMHSVKTIRFGPLSEDLVGARDDWGFIGRRLAKELRSLSSDGLLPKDVTNTTVEKFLENVEPPQCSDPRLLHNDLGVGNVIVLGNDLAGIIDLGDAMSGDPEYDLAKAYQGFYLIYDRLVVDALLEGYGLFDNGRFDYYLLFHACWTLRWFEGRRMAQDAERSRQLISDALSSF